MLSKRENFEECINGGNPDRFVNQYEAFGLAINSPRGGEVLGAPGTEWVGPWGVKLMWPEGQPGSYPNNHGENAVVQDISSWEDFVEIPEVPTDDASWEDARNELAAFDATDVFPGVFYGTGLFEQFHFLQGMDNGLMAFHIDPEASAALLDAIVEYELKFWEIAREKLPNAEIAFHHDDWGGDRATLMSPEMFSEFITPRYEKIYGRIKDLGFKYVIHHCDSYAKELVPDMIKMGIDAWQGATAENDVPALVEEFGGKISFMGNLNNTVIDHGEWSVEAINEYVDEQVKAVASKHYFIPCLVRGLGFSMYDGVYDAASERIDYLSKEYFPTL